MKATSGKRRAMTSVLIASMLFGCKTAPAPNVGFADPKLLKKDPSSPFDQFWRKPGVDFTQYSAIYVADVNTDYMLKMTTWQKGERQADIERDVKALGIYTHDAIVKAFRNDPKHRFVVIDSNTHGHKTLIFEMALIEVVPSKVLLNALGYAPFFIGTGITVIRALANDKSTAAFEARVRDAETGEIILLAADREAQQIALVDLRGLTWYSEVRGIIDDWATQFTEVSVQKPGEVVKGTSSFRLQPW